MKPMAFLTIALLALSASAVQARGIDCARASTELERMTCADPVMLDYDGRIAGAYARALAIWDGAIAPYVRRDQQTWLTLFRMIERFDGAGEVEPTCVLSDRACIRAELRRRVDAIESGAYVHSGVYRAANGMKLLLHPGLANGYRVRVYAPGRSDVNIVTADGDRAALWDGPDFMVSSMGDANGLPLPAEDGCTLRLLPGPVVMTVYQKGACGGHSFAGSYNRLLDETLQSYELELY